MELIALTHSFWLLFMKTLYIISEFYSMIVLICPFSLRKKMWNISTLILTANMIRCFSFTKKNILLITRIGKIVSIEIANFFFFNKPRVKRSIFIKFYVLRLFDLALDKSYRLILTKRNKYWEDSSNKYIHTFQNGIRYEQKNIIWRYVYLVLKWSEIKRYLGKVY